MSIGRHRLRTALVLGMVALAVCAWPGPARAKTIRVTPGQDLTRLAKQMSPGDTMVLAEGVYRGGIMLKGMDRDGPGRWDTVIEGEPGATVVIKGSEVVSGFRDLGDGLFVKDGWREPSAQVFVDGESLQQIGGSIFGGYTGPNGPDHRLNKLHRNEGGVWPGRIEPVDSDRDGLVDVPVNGFYWDERGGKLYVRLEPGATLDGRLVEASVQTRLLSAPGWNGLTIRNLQFEHSNTTAKTPGGAVACWGHYFTVENVQVRWADGTGLTVNGDDNVIRDCHFSHCGQFGLVAKGDRNHIENVETTWNNYRGFNEHWGAGGAKFVGQGGLRDSVVINLRAYYNLGDGIWFDWDNRNNVVMDCVSAYNLGNGLHYEASFGLIAVNNYLYGNGKRGIYLPHSSDCWVVHNLVAFNEMSGMAVIDTGRQDPKGELDLRTNDNRIMGNVVAWSGQGRAELILPSVRRDNISDHNLYVAQRKTPHFSLGYPGGRGWVDDMHTWFLESAQDKHSIFLRAKPSRELAQLIAERKPVEDWSELLLTAERMPVPANETMPPLWRAEEPLWVGPNERIARPDYP